MWKQGLVLIAAVVGWQAVCDAIGGNCTNCCVLSEQLERQASLSTNDSLPAISVNNALPLEAFSSSAAVDLLGTSQNPLAVEASILDNTPAEEIAR